jgi:Rha family phage regulatory protein
LICGRIAEAGPWGVLNFEETTYTASNGESYPIFTMTKNGYAFCAGRMTGKKAVEHQIAYIQDFNAMNAYTKSRARDSPLAPRRTTNVTRGDCGSP